MTTTNLGRVAIVPKGTYTAGPNKPLDLVRYQGASYLAKTTTSALPTVTSDWDLIAGDGASLYTWIKYADDSIGTGLSDSPVNKMFIGIAVNKSSATESTTASDYTWSQIKGNDGSPTYTWIKYADDAIGTGLSNTSTGKKYIGIAANKTSTTESTSASDYEWSLIISDPFYTWIKYATSATGTGLSDSPTGMTYIGIATNKATSTASTTASDYAWSLIKGDTGSQGVAGPTGATGATGPTGPSLYTWVKYADGADGTGLSDSPTGKSYIGIAINKTSVTESTTPTDYEWMLVKGTLVSGVDIKTINGNSIVGSGDVTISGGSSGVSTGKAIAMAIVFGG